MKENMLDILDLFFRSKMEGIHTLIPGRIEEYKGHGRKEAKVKPMVKIKNKRGEDLTIPPIDNVPVMFPSAASAEFRFPLKKGDGCLILFSEVSIGNYLNNTVESNPEDKSRFSLTDAICIPGLWSFNSVPVPESIIEIDDSGNINITAKANVNLNGSAKSFVTHGELDAAIQTFITALNLHTHPDPSSGTTGPPSSSMSLDISASETQTIKTGG